MEEHDKGIIVPPPDSQATVAGHPCLSFDWKLKMAVSTSKYTLITGLIREDLSLTLRPRTPGQMFSRLVSKLPRRVQSCGVSSCDVP